MKAPVKIPHQIEAHGHVRQDPYYWLRERDNPKTLEFLQAENDHVEKVLGPTQDLQEKLYLEMKARIKEDDASFPAKDGAYYYYVRYEKGLEYAIYCRRQGSIDAKEVVLLNVNDLAQGHEFFDVSGFTVSPDHKWLAYCVDDQGRRIYTLYFKNLETGALLPETIGNISPSIEWANDNQTCFYTTLDLETLRSDKIWRHQIGKNPKDNPLIYHEKDDTFFVDLDKSRSEDYLYIVSDSTLTSEWRYLSANKPFEDFQVFQPRVRKLEYHVYHSGSFFYVLCNADGASNYKLMKTAENNTAQEFWEEVIPHREQVYLEDLTVFQGFLVLEEKKAGLSQIRIIDRQTQESHYISFQDPSYTVYVDDNYEWDTPWVRYFYESLTTPRSTIDYKMKDRFQELRKQVKVLGDFQSENYQSERLWAQAQDGTAVPISTVYRKDLRRDRPQPLLLYAYGSYGIDMEPYFRRSILSLLDRGFIFALAHIRGGSEMGRHWYEDGKLLKKKNTFNDFISCSEFLIEKGYTSCKHLYAEGGSAGGMLMGAIANMRPDLYQGLLSEVPFVDVVTTMLDDKIPLTTHEYDEWGNPNKKEFYDYMLSYSPYDNVKAQDYPNLLVTTGLHDSQVQYWEPAKWVAKLREMKTDQNLLLLKTNMEAGHGGASGRFKILKEIALHFAFLLQLEDIKS